jgi:hypothetical protein
MAVNILLRRGTAAEWTASNPVLLEAEVGLETDTKKLKVGDGLTVWASLPYINLTPAAAASIYAPIANPTFTGTVSGVTKSMVGLGSVDNTTDANKPISTATQTALDLKAPLASPTFTGTVAGITKTMVGLGNVDNTTDANKPVSTAQQTALDLKASLASPTFTGTVSFDTGVALIFEGATADGFETTLTLADPTADRSLTLPNATGTLATQEHVASELGTHSSDTTSVHGITDTADLATKSYADTSVSTHSSDTTSVHGIADTADLATKSYADTAASNAVSTSLGTHEADTLSVHGITDTSLLVTTTGTQTLTNKTITTPAGLTKNDVGLGNVDNTSDSNKPVSTATQTALDLKASISAIAELAQDAVNTAVVAGVGLDKVYDDETNTITLDIDSTVATKTYADGAVSTHSSDTTSVHGITDTAELATKAYADSAVSTHTSDTTAVHGITDTSLLVTTTASQTLTNKTITTPLGLVKSDVGLGNVDNTADASKPVSTAQQTALDLKANLSGPTFTGTVSGITKTMVGLENVDNTTDVGKPVSTAQQTALDLKANLSGATFTGAVSGTSLTLSGDLTVNGTTTTLNSTTMSVDDKNIELGSVASPSDVTADGGGITLKGATDKTFNWVDATDSWTSSEHINLASGKDLKVNGTAVISSTAGGFIFTDGTQTKEGTPSRTPIIQKTDSYTLSALTERDSLIEVAKGSAATITIPLNSAVAFPVGTSIDILQTSTGQVTIAGDAGVTVNSTPGLKLRTQWSTATLFKRAENTWVVYGDLTA